MVKIWNNIVVSQRYSNGTLVNSTLITSQLNNKRIYSYQSRLQQPTFAFIWDWNNKLTSFTVWSSTQNPSISNSTTSTLLYNTWVNHISFQRQPSSVTLQVLSTYLTQNNWNWILFTSRYWNLNYTEFNKKYSYLEISTATIPAINACIVYDPYNNKRFYSPTCWFVWSEQFSATQTWSNWWWTWWTWWLWDVITDVWLDYIDWLWFNFDNNQNSWFCSEYSGWNINQYCSSYCSASLKSLCQKCATWLSPAEFSTLYWSCSFPASTWQFSSNNWDVVWYWDNWIVMFQKKDIVACNFQANWWCPEEFTLLDSVDYITCRVKRVWENIWKVWKAFKTIFWIFIFSESNLAWQDVLKLNWVSFTLWEDWERVYIYNTDASKIYSMLMNSIFTWWDILLAMYFWYNIIIFLLSKKEEKND